MFWVILQVIQKRRRLQAIRVDHPPDLRSRTEERSENGIGKAFSNSIEEPGVVHPGDVGPSITAKGQNGSTCKSVQRRAAREQGKYGVWNRPLEGNLHEIAQQLRVRAAIRQWLHLPSTSATPVVVEHTFSHRNLKHLTKPDGQTLPQRRPFGGERGPRVPTDRGPSTRPMKLSLRHARPTSVLPRSPGRGDTAKTLRRMDGMSDFVVDSRLNTGIFGTKPQSPLNSPTRTPAA